MDTHTCIHVLSYRMIKDSGMRIRVQRNLREAFVTACRARNRVAADVLREFMQTCVEQHEAGQRDLFVEATGGNGIQDGSSGRPL